MKKKLLMTITVIGLIFSFSNSILAQNRDFRNAAWGMSSSDVKGLESSNIIEQDSNKLVYECSLANIKGILIYNFSIKNELMGANYLLKPDYTNMNFYIRDYKMFRDLLTQKYGNPISTTFNTSDRQSVTESEWASFLSSGNLRLEMKWDTDKTQVMLTLSTIEGKPNIQIDYISKKYNRLDIQEKSNQLLRNL